MLQGKRLGGVLGDAARSLFGQNTSALLTFALTAVLAIAIVGGISGYVEKYLTTSVSQWVAHDLRMLLYQRIQRLSLAEHGKARTGDLVMRVTKDIDAVQDFIDTALLGIIVSVLTLVGMVGGHVVDELALHPRRAVGGAGVVSRRVFLLTPDQGRVANRQEEGE